MEQVVEYVCTDIHRSPFEYKTKYEYRPDRRWRWLQKALFWLLAKLHCYATGEIVRHDRYVVDTRKFMEALYRQHQDLLGFYNLRGERLLIGPDKMSELLGLEPTSRAFTFTSEYMQDHKVMEMKVTAIPWMRGMLVLPKGWDRE